MRCKTMEKTIWDKKWEILKHMMTKEMPERQNRKFHFFHYTSLPVLFSILEGNEFWAANVRFSNDEMEEKMLKLDNWGARDDYIICFCAENDMLSQWRGYCHNGGAAIQVNLHYPQTYSILHDDFNETSNYIVYENTPLPVVYLSPDADANSKRKEVERTITASDYYDDVNLEDILPYMKNGYFYEEKELRLVFSNINGNLSKCIRFRTLSNGIKVPYIVVRYGNVGNMNRNCLTDVAEYNDAYIKNLASQGLPIWIGEGFDQEIKYYEMMERVEEFKKNVKPRYPVKVFCRGRLPIEKITVSPTYDRERKAEQIKRFCMSKYWLNNVQVEVSKIPYIQPSL